MAQLHGFLMQVMHIDLQWGPEEAQGHQRLAVSAGALRPLLVPLPDVHFDDIHLR